MKNLAVMILLSVICLLSVSLNALQRIPGDIIIWFQEDKTDKEIDNFKNHYSDFSLKIDRILSSRFNIILFNFDVDQIDEDHFLKIIRENPLIKLAQFNHKVETRETIPNDPRFNEQWALRNTGQGNGTPGADISATHAWEYTTGGSTQTGQEIVIAVIDDGFALNHPDINWWKNENELPGTGQDNDGNGYIDDYDGWNAYNNSPNLPVNNHGTHVSGIIGAIGDNLLGVSGVGWDLKVMPIAGSSSSEAIVVAAYNYALENRILYNETGGEIGAYVVATNSSFGINYGNPDNYPIWGEMYNLMGEAGILSTAATMNINANVDVVGDVPTAFPSPYLISVTNTTNNDIKNSSAAYGATTIELGAPGTSILSTVSSLGYNSMTGTSMAAPHVAGVIGLMYAAASPSLLNLYHDSPGELALIVRELLLEGVDQLNSLENITVTGGRLNAHLAVLNIINYHTVNPPPTDLQAQLISDSILLTWLPPLDVEPDSYLIFRNDEYLNQTENIFYNDQVTDWGHLYEYFIVAYYSDEDEYSEPSEPADILVPPDFPVLTHPTDEQVDLKPPVDFLWSITAGSDFWQFQLDSNTTFDEPVYELEIFDEPAISLKKLELDQNYYWRVKSVNEAGSRGWTDFFSFTTKDPSDTIEEPVNISTGLTGNRPNPFNPVTTIHYYVSEQQDLKISIHNIKGQLLLILEDRVHDTGYHSTVWRGKDFAGQTQPSGVYFYRLSGQQIDQVKKMLLLK